MSQFLDFVLQFLNFYLYILYRHSKEHGQLNIFLIKAILTFVCENFEEATKRFSYIINKFKLNTPPKLGACQRKIFPLSHLKE